MSSRPPLDRAQESLALRLSLWFAVLFTAGFSAIFAVLYWSLGRQLLARDTEALQLRLRQYAGIYAIAGVYGLESRYTEDSQAAHVRSLFIQLVNRNGSVEWARIPSDWIAADTQRVPVPDISGGVPQQNYTVRVPRDEEQDLAVAAQVLPDGRLLQVARSTDSRAVLRLQPQALPAGSFRAKADGTYLVTGGLGALGLRIAGWLVERGARHLLLLGRKAPSAQAEAELQRWRARRVEVTVRAVDVADRAALAEVLRRGAVVAISTASEDVTECQSTPRRLYLNEKARIGPPILPERVCGADDDLNDNGLRRVNGRGRVLQAFGASHSRTGTSSDGLRAAGASKRRQYPPPTPVD